MVDEVRISVFRSVVDCKDRDAFILCDMFMYRVSIVRVDMF